MDAGGRPFGGGLGLAAVVAGVLNNVESLA